MEKKFYQTETFKMAVGIAIGIILYKIITGIFFS
jgi:hypothetical protein